MNSSPLRNHINFPVTKCNTCNLFFQFCFCLFYEEIFDITEVEIAFPAFY